MIIKSWETKEAQKKIQEIIEKENEKYCEKIENDARDIILQIIKSGDIFKYCNVVNKGVRSEIIYKPYTEREENKTEINRLTEIIKKNDICVFCGEKKNSCVCNDDF